MKTLLASVAASYIPLTSPSNIHSPGPGEVGEWETFDWVSSTDKVISSIYTEADLTRPRIEELSVVLSVRAPERREAAPRPRQSRQYRPLPASARTSTTNSDPELSASNITATQKPSYSSNLIVDVKEEYILSLVSVRVIYQTLSSF